MLSGIERATGATLLVPSSFKNDPLSDETVVMVKPYSRPDADEMPLYRKKRSVGTFGTAGYAETSTYRARPLYCVVPPSVQGMQFPNGVIIHMADWWPLDHMFYVAVSRGTSSDLVELRGCEGVTAAQWYQYTRVNARAMLLRAWGGEQPPLHVLEDALRRVRSEVARQRCVDASFGPPFPYDLNKFVVGGGMKGAKSVHVHGRRGLSGKVTGTGKNRAAHRSNRYKQMVVIQYIIL